MTWFKVDDSLAFHRKVIIAGDSMALWVRAGSWCAQQLTDGLVPREVIPLLGGHDHAETLVKVGLWAEVPDGYTFHDWEIYQPSREDVEAERAAARERMRDIRKRRKGVQNTSCSPERSGEQEANVQENDARSSADVRQPGVRDPRPVPTRPDPYENQGEADASPQTPSARGTRLPERWKPERDLVTDMVRELSRDQSWFEAEHRKFIDYWNGVPGAKGRKADWPGTWRNWMRRAAESNVRAIPQTSAPIDRLWAEAGAD